MGRSSDEGSLHRSTSVLLPKAMRAAPSQGSSSSFYFPHDGSCDDGLGNYIHPDGWKYFRRSISSRIVVMDEDPSVSSVSNSQMPVSWIGDAMEDGEYSFSLDAMKNEWKIIIVDHCRQQAWIGRGETQDIEKQAQHGGNTDYDAKVDYWNFMYQYPSHRSLPTSTVHAAKRILTEYIADCYRKKSDFEKAPFSAEQSKMLLEYFNHCPHYGQSSADQSSANSNQHFSASSAQDSAVTTMLISWIMLTHAEYRRLHEYGLHTKAKFIPKPVPTNWVFTILSCLFLGGPRGNLHHIRDTLHLMQIQRRTDAWAEYLDCVTQDITPCTLVATVLLTASVAFMVAPGMDHVTLVLLLLTMIFTLGNVITGTFIQRQASKMKNYNVDQMEAKACYMAVVFSAPSTLLSWSVILFLMTIMSYSAMANHPAYDEPSPIHFGRGTLIGVMVASSCCLGLIFVLAAFFCRMRKHGWMHAPWRHRSGGRKTGQIYRSSN